MIKGMEALLGEALLAARHYEVEQDVLESLEDLFPGLDWPARWRVHDRSLTAARHGDGLKRCARSRSRSTKPESAAR